MKKGLLLLAFIIAGLVVCVWASVKQGYQTATVVTVKKLDTTPQFSGGNPSDAPSYPEEFAYEIGLRLECTTYVGRYESATDYLPSVFKPNNDVDVRLGKHWMYISLYGDREVKMGIMRHERVHNDVCPAKN